MRYCWSFALMALMLFLFIGQSTAGIVQIELNTGALGLGSTRKNDSKGKIVDPDVPGLITSPTAGEGSILTVQFDGQAGVGTLGNPILMTVTASEHLDTTSGLPNPNDYQAGVIYISKDESDLSKEGLGVRAFTVIDATGLREIDPGTGRAKYEGSKDVSGGTGPSVYDSLSANGSPHVDEAAHFDIDTGPVGNFNVLADSIEVLLTKFADTDIIDLTIDLLDGTMLSFPFSGPTDNNPGFFEEIVADKVYKLKFSAIPGIDAIDQIDKFSIRANDDDPANPRGTAEHFLINSVTMDAEMISEPIPEPSTFVLAALGLLTLGLYRARRRRA